MSSGDETAQRALDLALRVLEPPQPAEAAAEPAVEPTNASEIDEAATIPAAIEIEPAADVDGRLAVVAEPADPDAELAAATAAVDDQGAVEAAAPKPAQEPEPVEPEPEPEREPIQEPIGLGIALGAAAEAALFAGDLTAAHDGLLAAARAHRRAGRLSAAVDACYLAIGLAPSDPDLHLLLTELYLDRGWRGQAVDKLLLLGRLADLDDDAVVRERLCALVTARLADEPRVAELCA
jgi:hypothetical protein